MDKTSLYTIGAIIGIIAIAAIVLMQRSPDPIDVSPEVVRQLEAERPRITEDTEAYLTLLNDNIISGGPPKDGIPSIDEPVYTTADEADEWLLPNDVVFGVVQDGFVAAYPQRILVWHEIVNEEIGGEKHSITYCPLTGTAVGFQGHIAEDISAELGVSGKLVNSNLIMYDRASDSYWSQILGQSITGPARGTQLEEFPVIWTTWERWNAEHPNTQVLSQDTGFRRNYGERGDPYGSYLSENMGYYASDRILFRPVNEDGRLTPKEVVVGIRDIDGNAAAIIKDTVRRDGTVRVELGRRDVVVTYDDRLDFYEARYADTGEWINAFDAFWFAWAAFYPDTQLIQ